MNERLLLGSRRFARMSVYVKEIGHRQVYDILQSRKPRATGG